MLENGLAPSLPLDGAWTFRLAGGPEQVIPVPSAWEAHTRDKVTDGPAHYRRAFTVPAEWLDSRRLLLEFGAVSFDAAVRVNGQPAGSHRGLWSPFQLDVTGLLRAAENTVEVEVWKPGGRFALRESLAGFLPDVCTTFGGLWQPVALRAFESALADVRVRFMPGGALRVDGRALCRSAGGQAAVRVTVDAPGGARVAEAEAALAGDAFDLTLDTEALSLWQPGAGGLYDVTVTLWEAGAATARAVRRTGRRELVVREGATWLSDRPLHMRGVLDWGWHPQHIRPTPTRDEVRQQFRQARALGFNMVKLCLFVPDAATFEVADEEGMLLWLEMPMWLPRVTPELRALALAEYRAVFERVHHHPSLVVLSLGCELNAEADAEFLQRLHALAREYFPGVLHCDNSGSAEAYGGVVTALSDFYDYHFYTDPHFFTALVQHFDRGYQPRKPWLYGEFCDADTCRNFSALPGDVWWLNDPVPLDRDDYLYMRAHRERLAAAGVEDGAAALTALGRGQAAELRKFIVEATRAHSATGGYVITGWMDTPIATSGVVDDRGCLKFDPEAWQAFNADAVLLIDRERRRRWVGGDRPAHRDPFSWRQGDRAELHVVVSNGLAAAPAGRLRWRLANTRGEVVAEGEQATGPLPAARVTEIAVLAMTMPVSLTNAVLELNLTLTLEVNGPDGSWTLRNSWRLFALPPARLSQPLALAGPLAHHHAPLLALDRHAKLAPLSDAPPGRLLLADAFTPDLLARVAEGGRGVVWLRQPDDRFTRALPFWREAIHVFEPHRLWQRVPHAGHADMRFFSVATDFALDLHALQNHLGPAARCMPVWRRFDARQLVWSDYVAEVAYGAGRLLVTTLRLAGGLGAQPEGLDANPWGAWLLASLLRAAAEEPSSSP